MSEAPPQPLPAATPLERPAVPCGGASYLGQLLGASALAAAVTFWIAPASM